VNVFFRHFPHGGAMQATGLTGTLSQNCHWYDVRRVSLPIPDGQFNPRLGELVGFSAANGTVCDGYGAREFQEKAVTHKCTQCPGDPYRRGAWTVLQCSAVPLVPRPSASWPRALKAPFAAEPISVLMLVSDHNNHGLFAQVERVLNQLMLAEALGLTPHVFTGQKVFNSPDSCDIGENQYFDPSRGDNVWEYYFEPVSAYRTGDERLEGRPVRAGRDLGARANGSTKRGANYVASLFPAPA